VHPGAVLADIGYFKAVRVKAGASQDISKGKFVHSGGAAIRLSVKAVFFDVLYQLLAGLEHIYR
jgi:hypothetical protein